MTDDQADRPIHTHYAHARYAASDTPGVIWYDPRDNREVFNRGLSEEIDNGERRVRSARVSAYRPPKFGVPPEQYITEISVEYGPAEGAEFPYPRSAVSSEVHDSLDAAQAHLKEHVPSYEQAPRRDAVLHRTGFEATTGNESEGQR